ncbi:DNA primase [Hydrogenobacter thermophilus]|uniref:DNA primase n=1 Tax=Hydrogenobacter thermophilus TaxID=940 RepID=UPI0030F78CF6
MSDREDILKRIDIVDVISSYIELKRTGNNYSARCPFHPDDTPSFFVSPSRGIFKCFGCGVGGDAVKFVALYENISYSEALVRLAKRYNVPIKLKESKKDTKVLHIFELVSEYYHNMLRTSPNAIDYLKSRGVSSRSIQRFMLGFSPSSEALVSLLKKEGVLDAYEKTGNIVKIDEGIYRDLFAGRIVIPIRDDKGRYVAFGGRVLYSGQPKYINSPESEFFKKREIIFGLYEGKDYIKDRGFAVIVEGYFDVISMHDEGYKNTVAPLGTSFGEYHARLLSRYTKEVILLFDGDSAGKRAVRQATPYLLAHGLKVRLAHLPEGEDPDTLAKRDRDLLRSLIDNAKDIFELLMYGLKDNQRDALRDLLYFAGFLKDKVYQHELLREVSKISRLPMSVLYEQLPKVQKEVKEDGESLTYAERVFLLGLMKFGKEDHLKDVLLSPEAMRIAEYILAGDYHLVPESVKNAKVYNLESTYLASYEKLKIDKSDFKEETKSILEMRKEKNREVVRFRRKI